tara:strand:- start:2871 stop:3203 length:333 start_codon:yes stop_codon:yes gene_type:complete
MENFNWSRNKKTYELEDQMLHEYFVKNEYQEGFLYSSEFHKNMLIVVGFKEIPHTKSIIYYHGVFVNISQCLYKASNVIDAEHKWEYMNFDKAKRNCLNALRPHIKALKF